MEGCWAHLSSIRSKQIVDMNILWSVVYCILTSLTECMPQSKCRDCESTGPGRGMQEWAAHSLPFLPETLQSASTSTSQPGSAVVVSYGRDMALQCCSAAVLQCCMLHTFYIQQEFFSVRRDDEGWLTALHHLCRQSTGDPSSLSSSQISHFVDFSALLKAWF